MSILTKSLAHQIRQPALTSQGRPVRHRQPGLASGLSYLKGDTAQDLEFITIPQLLQQTVARHGPRDAIVFSETGERRSYYDFARETDALAAGLLASGLQKGDRIGIWAPNCYEWVLTQFASARAGLIMVNINPAYRLAEVEYALNKSGCKALILARSFKGSDYLAMMGELAPELDTSEPGRLSASKLPFLKNIVVIGGEADPGMMSFERLRSLGGPAQQLRLDLIDKSLSPDDAINIQFTSGTTGQPKGATLSHYNIVNNARFVTRRIELTHTDRLCIPVPLYHCFGMVMGVLGAVSQGAAMVFPGATFNAEATLAAIARERCTALYGVPTMFMAMLQEIDKKPIDLSTLRTGIMAGAPCPVEVMEQVHKRMNMHEVTICYGMTETSPVSFQSFVDDPIDKRCTTVGQIHPHLEAKIVDTEGRIVPVGEQGELCTRGYSVMKGYWEEDERSRECVVDGWMHTGDLATLDEQGYCAIVGRVKDMIIRGGENIYPREIEEFIFRHPQVEQVQVFGIPHEKYGEEVCAWIISKPNSALSADAIRQFCQGQIAHYKVPAHIRLVDEIPMTITGKPQKFVMRDEMIKAEADYYQQLKSRATAVAST